ncbi:MAG: nucleotidyltransferase substrate binding protein [Polaromonas sp.]
MEQSFTLQLEQFKKALTAFDAAVAEDTGDVKSRNSILLSYVFTFEMAVKSLRLALAVRGLNTPDYAAAVLKAAFRAQLLLNAGIWEQLKDYRNNVSHAYDEKMAVDIAAFVREKASANFWQLLARLERDD